MQKQELRQTDSGYIDCISRSCQYKSECSTHESAGDFRSEGGFTPKIELKLSGELICHTKNSPADEDIFYALTPIDENTLGNGILHINHVIKEYDLTYDI